MIGAPTETIYHENVTEKQLWTKIKNADESKYVMTCGIGGGNTEEENSLGLFTGHVYTLIGAFESNGI